MANLALFYETCKKKKKNAADAAAEMLILLLTMDNSWAIGGSRGDAATFPRLFTKVEEQVRTERVSESEGVC